MLDVVYIAATLALFALVALAARGVERLGPRSADPAPRAGAEGGDHA